MNLCDVHENLTCDKGKSFLSYIKMAMFEKMRFVEMFWTCFDKLEKFNFF